MYPTPVCIYVQQLTLLTSSLGFVHAELASFRLGVKVSAGSCIEFPQHRLGLLLCGHEVPAAFIRMSLSQSLALTKSTLRDDTAGFCEYAGECPIISAS